jgi:hypothetical protein
MTRLRAVVFSVMVYATAAPLFAQSTTVTIASGSPAFVVSFNAGDAVDIVGTLSTTDVNENGEGEPLIITSTTGFSTTIAAYAQPTTASFTASAAGSISAYIQGYDGDESGLVSATINSTTKKRFTQAQKDAFSKASADLNIQAAAGALAAAICLAIPDPSITKICALAAGSYSGITWLLSAQLGRLALDPSDPNFMVLCSPTFPNLPLESGAGPAVDALNALIALEEQAEGYAAAMIVCVNRAQGAADAGDAFWEAQQLRALGLFQANLVTLLGQYPALLTNAVTQMQLAGASLTVTQSDAFSFEFQILVSGLPPSLAAALTALGADQATQDQIRLLAFVQDVNAISGAFPQNLLGTTLVADIQALVNALGIPVQIDIKPGSSTNPINRTSQGLIPVAILSNATFDALQIDASTLTFGSTGNEDSLAFCNQYGEDINGDGLLDLVCHFETAFTGFKRTDTVGVLKGATRSGSVISASDSVTIVR